MIRSVTPISPEMRAMFGLSEIIVFRRVERAERISDMRNVIGYPVSDFVANKCLDHFDHVSRMPFDALDVDDLLASARARAAILSRRVLA